MLKFSSPVLFPFLCLLPFSTSNYLRLLHKETNKLTGQKDNQVPQKPSLKYPSLVTKWHLNTAEQLRVNIEAVVDLIEYRNLVEVVVCAKYPDSPPVVRVVLAQTDCSLGHNMHYFPKHQTGIPQTTRGKGTKHDRVTFQLIVESSVNEVKSQVLTQVFRFIKFLVTTRKRPSPPLSSMRTRRIDTGHMVPLWAPRGQNHIKRKNK